MLIVLIPLNSGLVFTFTTTRTKVADVRLNPFEFRAGIYLTRVRKPESKALS